MIFFNNLSINSANEGTSCCAFSDEGIVINNTVQVKSMSLRMLIRCFLTSIVIGA